MRINKLILYTSKLEELTNFYIKLMELPVEPSGEREITIQAGSTELVFSTGDGCRFLFNGHGLAMRRHLKNVPDHR